MTHIEALIVRFDISSDAARGSLPLLLPNLDIPPTPSTGHCSLVYEEMSALPPPFQKIVDSLSAGRINLITACESLLTHFFCSTDTGTCRCALLLGYVGALSARIQVRLAKQVDFD